MNLVDRVNRQQSLTAISRTRRFGRIVANTSVPTTTYSYDANGNLIQAGGWSYMWDYLNRMLASGYNNSTTTYAYDPSGARVLQTSTTSTTYYPNKYYSFTSTKIGANTYATSTNYIWNGDTLLATIDQRLYNGAATGSPITRYIHPDHLGSTNAVTDQNGNLVQLLDYYPYGATRVSTSSYPTNEKRQYIGQFSDAQTNLNYLNARFYDGQRGQFLSEDPLYLQVGDPNQLQQTGGQTQATLLSDPQQMNAYSYSNDNPITRKDPQGLFAVAALLAWAMPNVTGDPIFNSDGTVSPTPQQRSLESSLFFAGLAAPGGSEVTATNKAADVAPQIAGKAGEAAAYLNQLRKTYTTTFDIRKRTGRRSARSQKWERAMAEQSAFKVAASILGSAQVADELFEALRAAGYVCAPIEPTSEMIEAGWADAHEEDAKETWKTMIKAAPK